MNEFIGFGGESPKEIKALLESNADATEKMKYVRYFDEDELAEHNERFLNQSVEYETLNDELDLIKKQYAGKMKPLKAENKVLLKELKLKGEEKDEEVYKIIDQEAKEVGYYSPQGILIHTRRIRKDEIQSSLFKTHKPKAADPDSRIEAKKTGTDDFKFTTDDDQPI